MKRIKILVEGQTEETFVRDVLGPPYAARSIFLTPILAETSKGHKGGIVSYPKVKNQLVRLCREDKKAYITTMIDFYGLPTCFPGVRSQHYPSNSPALTQVGFLEGKLKVNINESNFFPFIVLHEFEALLFSCPAKFGDWIDENSDAIVQNLNAVVRSFSSPEDINNSPHTAPSKRILNVFPKYDKKLHGPIIADDIGLDIIRQKCIHFDSWLKYIETLPEL